MNFGFIKALQQWRLATYAVPIVEDAKPTPKEVTYDALRYAYQQAVSSKDLTTISRLKNDFNAVGAPEKPKYLELWWNAAREDWLKKQWVKKDLSEVAWLREVEGVQIWHNLILKASLTLGIHDESSHLRKEWHAEMLALINSATYFKDEDSLAILLVKDTPPLPWIIAAMSSHHPQSSAMLDVYYPGAFNYFQGLRVLNIKPMHDDCFRTWMIHGVGPNMEVAELPSNSICD